MRGSWRPNITEIFWPQSYGRQRCVFLVLNRRPRAHSAGWWLSLLHLISIFSGPQTPSGSPRAPLARCGFPYHISSPTVCNSNSTLHARRTQLSYIIVRRPLDLWNRMFNRHQAEITVMQFTGHSLPVHGSMSVPWEFLSSSHFISQFLPTWFPLITAIRMCHLPPVYHLEWHFWLGQRPKYYTIIFPRLISNHPLNLFQKRKEKNKIIYFKAR